MGNRPKSRGVAPAELLVIAVALVAFTFVLTRQYTQRDVYKRLEYFTRWPVIETQPLRDRYGTEHFSSGVEEWVIRDYFSDRPGGFFIDVGANHYRDHSNTYFLESQLGWSGIAIDALEEFAADYATHRPRTKFFALFVSDTPGATATLFVPVGNTLVASSSQEFTVKEGHPGTAREVPSTTLNVLLEQQAVQRIDLLSMDIELAEPKALAGFDLGKHRPSLVCIESHAEVRQQILDYFSSGGYRLLGRYLRMDPNNLYFSPRDVPAR